MEVLKLEHLSPYLPYKLNCLVDGKESVLNAIYDNGSCVFYDLVESEKGFESVKPILKNIAYADNTIIAHFFQHNCRLSDNYDKEIIDLFCSEHINIDLDVIKLSDLTIEAFQSFPYNTFGWLLKNHYDVFGLVEKGLAVDYFEYFKNN